MDEQGGESMTTNHMNTHFTILGSWKGRMSFEKKCRKEEEKTMQNFRTILLGGG